MSRKDFSEGEDRTIFAWIFTRYWNGVNSNTIGVGKLKNVLQMIVICIQ